MNKTLNLSTNSIQKKRNTLICLEFQTRSKNLKKEGKKEKKKKSSSNLFIEVGNPRLEQLKHVGERKYIHMTFTTKINKETKKRKQSFSLIDIVSNITCAYGK